MRPRVQRLLVRLTSNARAQRLLERNVDIAQYLMGIGSGGVPESSGETVLVSKLLQQRRTGGTPLCVFDVGSNQGQFLGMIERGLRGKVPFTAHAFEPGHATFGLLSANLADRDNLVLNNFALGDQEGEVELFYDEAGSGLASLSKRRLDHHGIEFERSEKVQIRTLDGYCAEKGVESIDLLKLDVEGHELDVLKGASRVFAERRVAMLSFEFGGCNIDTRTYFQDFWYCLQESGMTRIFRISPSGHLVRIPAYRELHEQFRTTNFFALRAAAG